jgi:hypothetical protein
MTTATKIEGEELADLCILEEDRVPYAFCIRTAKALFILPPETLPNLIDAASEGVPLQIDHRWDLPSPQGEDISKREISNMLRNVSRWLPNHFAMRSIIPEKEIDVESDSPPTGKEGWEIRSIGEISVAIV